MIGVYCVSRYIEGSTKESTHRGRDKGASRAYNLRSSTCLPSQKVVLTVSSNKAQLIDLIVTDIVSHKTEFQAHILVVTGSSPVPLEVKRGQLNQRTDLRTTQEEADTMIVQQVSRVQTGKVLVVADDTDVFVLLLHFCHLGNIKCHVFMVSPIHG